MAGIGGVLVKVSGKVGKVSRKAMPFVGTVKRMKGTGGAATPETIHENVPCDVDPMGSGGGGQPIRAKAAYKIIMAANLEGERNSVEVGDVIEVEPLGLQPGRSYKVESVEQERGVVVVVRGTIET